MASLPMPPRALPRPLLRGLGAGLAVLALVVGVPWGLIHFVGLPHHLPTTTEVSMVLLTPLSTGVMIAALAAALWVAWALFTLDVIRCTVSVVRVLRLPDWSQRRGPVHGVAAVLVGAILLPLLTSRATPTPPTSLVAALVRPVAVTAPAFATGHTISAPILRSPPAQPGHSLHPGHPVAPAPGHPVTVVRSPDPRTGVHDSLSRIAQRELGDAGRWPEIFALNRGAPVPGGTFTRPSLIYPGQHLLLPAPASSTAPSSHPPGPDRRPEHADPERRVPHDPDRAPSGSMPTTAPTTWPSRSTIPPHPERRPTSTPAPARPSSTASSPPPAPGTNTASLTGTMSPSAPRTTGPVAPPRPTGTALPAPASSSPGITIGPETYVGFALGAAVSAALVAARRRHRRTYRPGSGRRDDVPVTPTVYALRLAHLRPPETSESPDDPTDLDTNETDDLADPYDDPAIGAESGDPVDPVDPGDPYGDPSADRASSHPDRRPDPRGPWDEPDPPDGPGGGSTAPDTGPDSGALPAAPALRVTDPGSPESSSSAQNVGSSVVDRGPASTALVLGTRDGREVAVDIAALHGLGLVGHGAPAALRAAVTTLLTASSAPTQSNTAASAGNDRPAPVAPRLVLPAADRDTVLPSVSSSPSSPLSSRPRPPAAVRLTDTLDDALDLLEAEILTRSQRRSTATGLARQAPLLVLAASVPPGSTARLQAVLDNGARHGVIGLLLGSWPAGATAHVRADGVVSATDPGPGQALTGLRLYVMSVSAAADVLDLLDRANPTHTRHDDVSAPTTSVPGRSSSAVPATSRAASTAPSSTTSADPVSVDLEVTATRPPDPSPSAGRSPEAAPELSPARSPVLAASPSTPQTPRRQPVLRIVVFGRPRVYRIATDAVFDAVTDAPHTADGSAAEVDQGRATQSGEGPRRSDVEVTGAFQPRIRELLVFLAMHPGGVAREEVLAAFFPESTPAQATNSVNTLFSRLRRAVRTATDGAVTDVVRSGHGSYELDPDVVEVDFVAFGRAQHARRTAADAAARLEAQRAMIALYAGPLADGVSAEWVEPWRESLRREILDAVAAAARAMVDSDPEATLELLEHARGFDPYNELLYRDIMRLQARLGRRDAVGRTLALLTTHLGELGEQPSPDAVKLAARLEHRAVEPADAGDAVGRDTGEPGDGHRRRRAS